LKLRPRNREQGIGRITLIQEPVARLGIVV